MKKKVKFITDSASDISVEDEKALGIEVLPFKVAIGQETFISRVDFDNEKFYKMLADYSGIPVTSQITAFEFAELYYEYFKQGYEDLVLVLINSEGSATYLNSVHAQKMFFEEHPECIGKIEIHTFDGKSYTGAYGEVVLNAVKRYNDGVELNEILDLIQEELDKTVIYFGMYTLKYAGKSGRIPSAAAFVGEALGLKPIMKIYDHQIITSKKARGEKKMLLTIVEMIKNDIEEGTPYQIVYGSDSSVCDEIEEKLTKVIGYPPVRRYQIGAAIAINAGPKVVGAIFHAKKEAR